MTLSPAALVAARPAVGWSDDGWSDDGWSATGWGAAGTALLDLFSEVRLSQRAEVLVVTHGVDAADTSTAIPVRAAASPDAFVAVSAAGLRLEVPRWSSPGRPVWFLSLHACTFAEFVGCT